MRSTALPSGPVVDLAELREALTTTTDVAGLAVPGYAFAAAAGVLLLGLLAMLLRRSKRHAAAKSGESEGLGTEAAPAAPLVHAPEVAVGSVLEPGMTDHGAPETIPPVGPVFAKQGHDLPGTLSAPQSSPAEQEQQADPWAELQEQAATYLTGGPASNPDLVAHPISGETSHRQRRGTPDADAAPVARQGSRSTQPTEESAEELDSSSVLIPDLPPGSHTRPDTTDWLTDIPEQEHPSEVADQAQAWLESITPDEAADDNPPAEPRPDLAAPVLNVEVHTTTWVPEQETPDISPAPEAAESSEQDTAAAGAPESQTQPETPTDDMSHTGALSGSDNEEAGPADHAEESASSPAAADGDTAAWSQELLTILATGSATAMRAAAQRSTRQHDKTALLLAAAAIRTHDGDDLDARALIVEALELGMGLVAAVPQMSFKLPLVAQYSAVLLPVTTSYARLWLAAQTEGHDASEHEATVADAIVHGELIRHLARFNTHRGVTADGPVEVPADTAKALGLEGVHGKRTRVDEWAVLAAHARLLVADAEDRVERGHQLRGILAAWRTTPPVQAHAPGAHHTDGEESVGARVVLGTAQMHTDVIAAITGR